MNGGAEVASAKVVLSEVMGMYKHEMSALEIRLWLSMIHEFGDKAVIAFLVKHSGCSEFAPKPSECRKLLQPGEDGSAVAFETAMRAVAEYGPYRVPRFLDPAVSAAIKEMGGWVRFNELAPDASARFDYEAFAKRFEVAYKIAVSRALRHGPERTKLMSVHDVSRLQMEQHLAITAQAQQLQLQHSNRGAQ